MDNVVLYSEKIRMITKSNNVTNKITIIGVLNPANTMKLY